MRHFLIGFGHVIYKCDIKYLKIINKTNFDYNDKCVYQIGLHDN